MSKLAEKELQQSDLRLWAGRVGVGLAALGVLAGLAWLIAHISADATHPRRQVAKISVLPETPPPPPPPKDEKKPEPPKDEPKQAAQVEQPKPEQVPEQEPPQLKEAGAAGDGPSPFASGDVKSDYKGGDIGGGTSARSKFAAYTTRLERLLQQELVRRKLPGTSLKVYLWLAADGSVQRYKLVGRNGAEETDPSVRSAFADLRNLSEPPPADMPMPVGLQVTTP